MKLILLKGSISRKSPNWFNNSNKNKESPKKEVKKILDATKEKFTELTLNIQNVKRAQELQNQAILQQINQQN